MSDATTKRHTFSILILLLLLVDNLFFNYAGIKIRVSELIGIIIFCKLVLLKIFSKQVIKYPQASGYFIVFILASSVSMIDLAGAPFKEGLQFQLHIIILFFASIAIFNKACLIDNERLERVIFIVADTILLYAVLQIVVYYIFGHLLTFGMERWADPNIIISYRQDFIDPKAALIFSENAPWFRPPSIFGEPVFLGVFCAWIIIICIIKYHVCLREEKTKWLIRLLISSIISVFIASRALWITTASVLIYYIIIHGNKKLIKKLVLLGSCIIIILFIISKLAGLDFVSGIVEGRFNANYIESDNRSLFIVSQLNGFLEKPWIGHGRGMTHDLVTTILPESFDEVAQAVGGYSFWITLLYDTGILGLCTFLLFVIKTLNNKVKILSLNMSGINPFKYGFVGIIIYGLLLGPILSYGTFWFALVMVWLSNNKVYYNQDAEICTQTA